MRDPVSRLAKLLLMDPREYVSPVAPGQVPAPVWDENKFIAGRLTHSAHLKFWGEVVLHGHPDRKRLLFNMKGMEPDFQHFRGRFGGKPYDCDAPPNREFRNNWPDLTFERARVESYGQAPRIERVARAVLENI